MTSYFRDRLLQVESQSKEDTVTLINEEVPNLSLPFHPELLFLSVAGAQTAAYQLQNTTFSCLTQTLLYRGPFNTHNSKTHVVTELNTSTTLNLPIIQDPHFILQYRRYSLDA